MIHTNNIFVYGFTPNEEKVIKKALPAKDSILTSTDCFTDIIACSSYAAIIKMSAVSDVDLEMLWDYCIEVGFAMSETIILVGNVNIPKQLKKKIQAFSGFEELQDSLKYVILSAYHNNKKQENFSSTLANAIMVLSRIRLHPGITTIHIYLLTVLTLPHFQSFAKSRLASLAACAKTFMIVLTSECPKSSCTSLGWSLSCQLKPLPIRNDIKFTKN